VGVYRSPKPLTIGLVAVGLLCSGFTASPVAARNSNGAHRHAAALRQAQRKAARQACHRRGECRGDTGGTSPTPARTPRVTRHERVSPKAPVTPDSTPAPRHTPAEQAAAVIAGVLATPCSNTEVSPSAENIALVRAAVNCLINRVRAEHGLNPLTMNARLESAAESHCAELISANYFAHVAPDGETPVDRIRKTGYIPGPSVGYVIGENLAWGTYSLATPQSIVSAWIASPGHLANILESQYKETGIGIVPAVPQAMGGGNPGASYAQEFGVIIH